MPFIEWSLSTSDLCLNFTRTQVEHKHPFELDAAMFEAARKYHEGDGCQSYRHDDGIAEMREVVDDIEYEEGCNCDAHKDCEKERQTVETTLRPQGSKLVAMVFLHDDATKKWRDEQNCDNGTQNVCHRPSYVEECPTASDASKHTLEEWLKEGK